MNEKTWVPLGEAIKIAGGWKNTPPIRNGRMRKLWARRNSRTATLALYNDGMNLYSDPHYRPADTYYNDYLWSLVAQQDFSIPAFALASDRLIAGILRDQVWLQLLPGNEEGREKMASIRVGGLFDLTKRSHVPDSGMKFDVPPRCILYLAVRYGRVADCLMVYQPLPGYLFSTLAPRMQTYQEQWLIAT